MYNLESYILPYPYEAYDEHNRLQNHSFEEYKNKIYSWVKQNSCRGNMEKLAVAIRENINDIDIQKWLLNHLDNLKYIFDFSGLCFGIQFEQQLDEFSIRFPRCIRENDKQLYPQYDEESFINMGILDKLEWIYSNCEFIPFRIIFEDFYDSDSHKFSHIKSDTKIMEMLKDYLAGLQYPPSDNVYYYIHFDSKKKRWYLSRDLHMSPKQNSYTNKKTKG